MRGWTKFLVAAVVVCAALYGVGLWLWDLNYPSCQIRYRLTVAVDADGARRVGSGVVEADYWLHPQFPESGPVGISFTGYAITIDLGEKGLLFVLDRPSQTREAGQDYQANKVLRSTTLGDLPRAVFDHGEHERVATSESGAESFRLYCHALREYESAREVRVPDALLPLFVRFWDQNDRGTLQEVNPERLDEIYGPGLSLNSVTLQIVDDPISPMPTTWPKWISDTATSRDWEKRGWHSVIGDVYISEFVAD
jgi:hypothetical protein